MFALKPLAPRKANVRSEVVGLKRPAIKLSIQPAQHANLSSAETFQPTVDQKRLSSSVCRYLRGFRDDRSCIVNIQLIRSRYLFGSFRRLFQGIKQLRNPGVQLAFGGVVSDRLQDSDRQTILGAIEIENVLAGLAALLLFPLKQLFNLRVLDDRDSLIKIKKPLDHIGKRVVVDIAVLVAAKYG